MDMIDTTEVLAAAEHVAEQSVNRVAAALAGVSSRIPPVTGDSHRSVWSSQSTYSALSLGSMASIGSLLSMFSLGSALSIGSTGSVLSIGSVGSVLSIGSVGSTLSIGKIGGSPSAGIEPHAKASEATIGRAAGLLARVSTAVAVAAVVAAAFDH